MDYNDFAGQFGAWAELFKPFIEGSEMDKIYSRLKRDAEKDTILPYCENTFKVFAQTHPDQIKSIWYLMDPYPRRYKDRTPQATGIAMDCSNSPDERMQPSLEVFYDAMEKDLGRKVDRSLSLSYLLDQGIMLTNTDLTVKMNKTASHNQVWEPFQKYFLENIMGSKQGIIYVLAGKASHRIDRYIQPIGNHIIKLEHPAAAHRNHVEWECGNIFSKINRLLKENNNGQVYWNKTDWKKANNPPF